jgi:hypothetical protein
MLNLLLLLAINTELKIDYLKIVDVLTLETKKFTQENDSII